MSTKRMNNRPFVSGEILSFIAVPFRSIGEVSRLALAHAHGKPCNQKELRNLKPHPINPRSKIPILINLI